MVKRTSSEKEEYKVKSNSRSDVWHIVKRKEGKWECSCEAYQFKKIEGYICKHILEVRMFLNYEKRSKTHAKK